MKEKRTYTFVLWPKLSVAGPPGEKHLCQLFCSLAKAAMEEDYPKRLEAMQKAQNDLYASGLAEAVVVAVSRNLLAMVEARNDGRVCSWEYRLTLKEEA